MATADGVVHSADILPHPADSAAVRVSTRRPRLSHVPRLSIAHLLAATFVTSLVLAAMARLTDWGDMSDRSAMLAVVLYVMPITVGAGWLIFTNLLIGWHLIRRTLWKLEPGEWLVLGLGGIVGGYLMLGLLEVTLWSQPWIQDWRWLNLTVVIAVGLAATAPLIAGAAVQWRRPWWCALHCFYLLCLVLCCVWMFYGHLMIFPDNIPEIAVRWCYGVTVWSPVVLMMLGILSDFRRRQPRHWLHWSGIMAHVLILLPMLIPMTYSLVFD